jgi:uncharacterized membrane protein
MHEFFNQNIQVIQAILALVVTAITATKLLYELHERMFASKRFLALTNALSYTAEGSLERQYLQQVLSTEIFKIGSGVRTTDKKAKALMQICAQGLESSNRLKSLHDYIDPQEDGTFKVTIFIPEKIYALFNLGAAIFTALGGVYLIVIVFLQAGYNSATMLISLCIEIVTIGLFIWFIRDYARYVRAVRVQKTLKQTTNSCAVTDQPEHPQP